MEPHAVPNTHGRICPGSKNWRRGNGRAKQCRALRSWGPAALRPYELRRQNAERSPTLFNVAWACCGEKGRHSGERRSPYQALPKLPDVAPAGDVLFRPEEQHGLSGEDDVLVPAGCRHSEMNDAFRSEETSFLDYKLHGGVAAGTRGGDPSVAAKH